MSRTTPFFHSRMRRVSGAGRVLLWMMITMTTTMMMMNRRSVVVSAENFDGPLPPDFLTADSVVMITGAAGFLGSELALALHRTYQVKKLILIDSIDKGFGHAAKVMLPLPYTKRTEQDLALFEFKRQRVFHLLQSLGPQAYFYRVDLRPSIPEYFDSGEVPVLHHIFQQHDDITHVVHLADHYHQGHYPPMSSSSTEAKGPTQQAVPRLRGQPKAGMMEAMLEHLRLYRNQTGRLPHFTYASSYEVYNHMNPPAAAQDNPHPPPFAEDKPITTPSSLAGTAKLLDEILAHTYHQMESTAPDGSGGLFSIGLRFFCVYGPWGLPGSPLFEMAERIVTGEAPELETDMWDDLRDYIYIDDAVDAMMAAMQFRPPTTPAVPLVINVGSGQGTSLRSVAQMMRELLPVNQEPSDGPLSPPRTTSIASIERAQNLLGFQPRVELPEGLERLLAWHYDRAFPYGGKPLAVSSNNNNNKPQDIAHKGIVSCSPYDDECLQGTPVFPCASECSHQEQCVTSMWDDVLIYTNTLTYGCPMVLYTVALDEEINLLPSTIVKVSASSQPYVEGNKGHCNLAFVSETGNLYVQEASRSRRADAVVKHGSWILIPVAITDHARSNVAQLQLLPKLSPGLFFARSVVHAIYADPNVIFDSIPRLLEEVAMQPAGTNVKGATALLVGKRRKAKLFDATVQALSPEEMVQENAYRMIRIAVIEEMLGDGFATLIDASFVVHLLNNEDSRLFRCDVYGEVVQWDVTSDRSSFEFILGLHDMWSRVIVRNSGQEPWWIGDNATTVVSQYHITAEEEEGSVEEEEEEGEGEEADVSEKIRRRLQEIQVGVSTVGAQEAGGGAPRDHGRRLEGISIGVEDLKAHHQKILEHNGFGVSKDAAGLDWLELPEVENTAGDAADAADAADGPSETTEATEELDPHRSPDEEDLPLLPGVPLDPSSYDTWMAILSSREIKYFGRIVSMEAVGVVHVDDEGRLKPAD